MNALSGGSCGLRCCWLWVFSYGRNGLAALHLLRYWQLVNDFWRYAFPRFLGGRRAEAVALLVLIFPWRTI